MAESLGEAVLDLRAEKRGFDADIDQANRKAEGLDKTFTRIGGNLSAFGDKMTLGVTLPLAAAGAAAFKLASDAEENSNKFEIVMGGAADRTRAALKELETSIPLTTGQLLGLAAGAQDLLVPMGLARDAGADMSLQFVELAGDISAFNNVPVAQVLADIKSGLVGSSEPLFKYGVDTRVAALETVALANGLIEEGEKLNDVARAQAVLLQIQAQSTDAMGAAAREADGAAQSTAFFMREIKQLGETIGSELLPIVTPMIQKLTELVRWFGDLDEGTRKWVVRIGLAAAAIGPLLSITGRLLSVGGKIAGMMITNTAATTANTTATTANTAAVGASGLAKGLGVATLALAAFWAGWKAGEFLAEQLGIQENALANWLDGMEFFGPSIQEIRADTDEAAKSFGTYRTAAELAEENTLRLAAANIDAAAAIVTTTAATTAAVDPATKYAAAIAALGIVSEKELTTELNNLALAIESGEVPAATMRPLLEEYRLKLEELGRLSPEVATQLDGLTDSINEQDAAIDGIVGEMPKATNALDLFGGSLADLPPVAKATGDSIEDALTRMALASDSNAFALAGVIAEQQGLTFEQGLALTAYRDNGDQVIKMAEQMRGEWGPAIQDSANRMVELTDETAKGTQGLGSFFGGLKTGIPVIDGFVGKIGGFLDSFGGIADALFSGGGGGEGGGIGGTISGFFGKLTGGIKDGADGLIGKLGGLFGGGEGGGLAGIFGKLGGEGAGGLLGGLTSILGSASSFIPVIGPLISAFGPMLIKGLGKLAGKIGGAIKRLFGGPSGAELEARKTANAMNETFASMVDSGTRAAEGLTETWQLNNVAQRDMILALGGTVADVEATWDRFKNAAKDPAIANEMDAFWKERVDKVQAAMTATGSTLTELRNDAINKSTELGISVAEAFEAIANGTIDTMKKTSDATAETATKAAADFAAAQTQILADASLSAEQQQLKLAQLAATHNDTLKTMVGDTAAAQTEIASVAVSAAAATETAWVTSATRTAAAWDATRKLTVGASSILDIQVLGSGAAKKLGDDQAAAAQLTEEEWQRVNAGLAMGVGGDAARLRQSRDVAMDGRRDSFRSGSGGSTVLQPINLDGREITRVVLKLTPEVRSKLGIR